MTNLDSLDSAIKSYQKRFDIEQMFRDFKSGGYNLEGTLVTDFRLRAIILLVMIAYTPATFQGKKIKRMGLQKYVGRVKEFGRTVRRHSSFYIGLYGESSAAGGSPSVGNWLSRWDILGLISLNNAQTQWRS